MELITNFLHYAFSFILVISIVVSVHEFGHYIVAKWCGVKVEVFSIGFGREIFGFNDKSGTRWKFSQIPLGGYVKMFGDSDPSSNPDRDVLEGMSPEDKKVAFHYKSLPQKAAIVAAGPIFNFLLAIIIYTFFFSMYGRPVASPAIGDVVAGSAAEEAGLRKGDLFLELDGQKIKEFKDIQGVVFLNKKESISAVIKRGEEVITVSLSPKYKEIKDMFGNKVSMPQIGVASGQMVYKDLSVPEAIVESVREVYLICERSLKGLGQIISGQRSTSELSGTLRIAKYSGQSLDSGIYAFISFITLLSVNLGLVNLFPIPVLDGGHLMYYAVEAFRGRPLAAKFQDITMRVGLVLIAGLMILTLFNDMVSLGWL